MPGPDPRVIHASSTRQDAPATRLDRTDQLMPARQRPGCTPAGSGGRVARLLSLCACSSPPQPQHHHLTSPHISSHHLNTKTSTTWWHGSSNFGFGSRHGIPTMLRRVRRSPHGACAPPPSRPARCSRTALEMCAHARTPQALGRQHPHPAAPTPPPHLQQGTTQHLTKQRSCRRRRCPRRPHRRRQAAPRPQPQNRMKARVCGHPPLAHARTLLPMHTTPNLPSPAAGL